MSAPDTAAVPGAGWDEAQCTAALARLEQLQAQVDDLRLAIPRIIEPFHRPPNPTTFKLYAQGVVSSQNGIKNLHEQWKKPEMQSTFEHVKESYSANADLSACVSLPEYGWIEREQKQLDSMKSAHRENEDDAGSFVTDEELSQTIVDFQKANPNIKLDAKEDNRSILTQFVSGSVKLKFRVSIEREASGRHKLAAECLGTMEPFLTVTRCIASRPKANDLRYLLEMIAAYKTVKGLSCAKCGQLLDKSTLSPLARRSKQVSGTNESTETIWQAFHESCLV